MYVVVVAAAAAAAAAARLFMTSVTEVNSSIKD